MFVSWVHVGTSAHQCESSRMIFILLFRVPEHNLFANVRGKVAVCIVYGVPERVAGCPVTQKQLVCIYLSALEIYFYEHTSYACGQTKISSTWNQNIDSRTKKNTKYKIQKKIQKKVTKRDCSPARFSASSWECLQQYSPPCSESARPRCLYPHSLTGRSDRGPKGLANLSP